MKPLIPTTLILSSLTLLAFTFLLPTSSSNQLAAIASTPSITFKESTLSVTEGDRLKVTIVAPATLTSTTRVKVTTKSGTAKTGTDFTPVNATVTFYKGGLKEKSITLVTKSDTAQEQAEVLTLSLSVSNRVVNTTTVTLNDKGTGGTTGPTLPASANQGNTLGGNPSFTTYSPQGLPQPMNPRCKQVPSKYTFTQNKFPPNNPSNPFYTWEDVYGAAFPLYLITPGFRYTFTLKAFGYNSYQFQVPPVGSPFYYVDNPWYTEIVHYPVGSHSNRLTFVSECPWQDYYDEVIAFEGGTSPIAKEFFDVRRTRGYGIYQDPVFLQSDLYKRYQAEQKRLLSLAGASGRCYKLNSTTEDLLLDITSNKDYFVDPSQPIDLVHGKSAVLCYVKPGGTYYFTTVSYDADSTYGTFPQRTYTIWPRFNNGINTNGPQENDPSLTLRPRKLCLLRDSLRTDCWMGALAMGVERETDERRQEGNRYRWISLGDPSMTGGSPASACRPGTIAGADCNNTETRDWLCVDASQSYVCENKDPYADRLPN